MKNTICPLDIVFCKDRQVISIEHGRPLSIKNIGPDLPSDLVLEFPAGFCHSVGLKIGDSVEIKYSLQTLAGKFIDTIKKIAK